MSYKSRLIEVRAESYFDFGQRTGKPITMEEAYAKAGADYDRWMVAAEKERNEKVVDLSTGKTYRRREI